eukprot:1194758-Prorocentrum_minimum.AAC.2
MNTHIILNVINNPTNRRTTRAHHHRSHRAAAATARAAPTPTQFIYPLRALTSQHPDVRHQLTQRQLRHHLRQVPAQRRNPARIPQARTPPAPSPGESQRVRARAPLVQPLAERVDQTAPLFLHFEHEKVVVPAHQKHRRRRRRQLVPDLIQRHRPLQQAVQHGALPLLQPPRLEETHKGARRARAHFWRAAARGTPAAARRHGRLEVEVQVWKARLHPLRLAQRLPLLHASPHQPVQLELPVVLPRVVCYSSHREFAGVLEEPLGDGHREDRARRRPAHRALVNGGEEHVRADRHARDGVAAVHANLRASQSG